VIDNTVAVPLPHYYRLLDVASTYKRAKAGTPSVHPLYQEPMSDLIPVERIHEYWERFGDWSEKQRPIEEAARSKAYALSLVVERLEDDLKPLLSRQAAPPIHRSPRPMNGLAPQGRLWFEYTRLNAALDSLEAHATRSMPPHEREARLKSARLIRRLSGIEEQRVLEELSRTLGRPITPGQDIFVYKMSGASREVNVRPGDFTYALAPEGRHGFLDDHPYPYIKGTSLEGVVQGAAKPGTTIAEVGMTGVSIAAIDRVGGFIALRAGERCCIRLLELVAGLDFSRDVILDPVHRDFLTKKVQLTVQGIGNPPSAVEDPRLLEALGLPTGTIAGATASSPAAEVLWEAPKLHGQRMGRSLLAIRSKLASYFSSKSTGLDSSQWEAWEAALSLRFSLVWGPPGTGKSRTLRAVVLGAVLEALATKRPLRLLITANTYTAVDNVLLDVEKDLKGLLSGAAYDVYRIQSKWHISTTDLSIDHPDLKDLTLNTAKPSDEIKALRERLEKPSGIVVVGCVPQQLHNLSVAGKSKAKPRDTIRSWFDLVVLDEASQMDVATSTLIFTKLMLDGSCVLAGDDLQLPPIQQAEPPQDLEYMVGSVYNYFRRHHDIEPKSLDINYRSNSTIVEFTRMAGYSQNLKSYSPDLKLHLSSPIPALKPHDWPIQLYWSPEWGKFLDPDYPAVCFIYDDRLSSQINDFESDAVAALLWLLKGRRTDKLKNEKKPEGSIDTTVSSTHYTEKDFWGKAVGVVTPHRAQMAKTIYRLQQVFPTHNPDNIRNAVDTVERFQGQQRDVIIASFGLGDPDIISSEDEFLYNLNRFNVLTSRARAKLIVFVTRTLLEHLSNDTDVLKESRLLKQFAESYCTQRQNVQVGYIKDKKDVHRSGALRRK
jgi:DNA replication ATP-dependent helicase Dna2